MQDRLAPEQHDVRARDARGACTGAPRPRKRGAVRLGRVGRREHQRLGVLPALAQLAEALDRASERELGTAEPFDEVATATQTERLERTELRVDGAVTARNPLRPDAVARHDPVPLEEELRERAPVRRAGEEPVGPGPAAGRRSRPLGPPAGEAARPPLLPRAAEATRRPERRPGIVRHLARPDEIPERGQCQGLVETGLGEELVEEERAGERRPDALVLLTLRARCSRHAAQDGGVLAEVERDAVRAGADPHHLAARRERVQVLGPIARDAPRQDLGLPERDRQRERLERHERLPQRRAAVDAVPAGEEAGERLLLDGLDLLPQRGERSTAQPAQHVRVAPFPLIPARPELTAHELLVVLELGEDGGDVAPEPLVRLLGRKRAATLRVAQYQLPQRLGPALEERLGEA